MNKWIIWCNLNDEQDKLEELFKGKCVSIRGSTSIEKKIEGEKQWREGNIPILITKPECFGYGMNWQCCNNMIFVGLSDSFEQYFQAVRRCYRFGQKENVNVHIIVSEAEGSVLNNIKRKEKDFYIMLNKMVEFTKQYVQKNLKIQTKLIDFYNPVVDMILPKWLESEK